MTTQLKRSRSASETNGYVLWENDSIVAILSGLTRPSENPKTGPMVQTWILVKAENPVAAMESKNDALVCGNCPLRAGACYVNKGQAPYAVWKSYSKGKYPPVDWAALAEALKGKNVRFGAYGDPAFVPFNVWDNLSQIAAGWTGYTHQWRRPLAQPLKRLVMASVDSHEEQLEATKMGWRTFRVQAEGQMRFVDEVVCPASEEGGKRTTCNLCRLCRGTSLKAKNVVINAHGKGKLRVH